MIFPYTLIDLTHTLNSSISTWNGGCGFDHTVHIDYHDCKGQDIFRVMKIIMHAGIGTHMDAPSHCIPGGKTIADFNLNDLIFPCIVIDLSQKMHARYSVSQEDIINFEKIYGTITKNSCVLIRTGWETWWNTPLKYHNNHVFPSLSLSAAHLLVDRQVAALGIDTLSPDRPEDGFAVHRLFLGNGNILIENVAHLDSMPAVNGFVMIAPLKIEQGTESPIRLIGLVEKA